MPADLGTEVAFESETVIKVMENVLTVDLVTSP